MAVLDRFMKRAERNVADRVYREEVVAEAKRLASLDNMRRARAEAKKRNARLDTERHDAIRAQIRESCGDTVADALRPDGAYDLIAVLGGSYVAFTPIGAEGSTRDLMDLVDAGGFASLGYREHFRQISARRIADERLHVLAVDPTADDLRKLARR